MLNARELRIHRQLLRASANFKNSSEAIVVILFAVARSKLFRELKRRDLVEYIVEDLKIDSTFTFDLNRVVRAGLEHPKLERALRERRLTVSKATRILSALKPENTEELIGYAATHTYAETNRFVASGQPAQNCRETWKQLSTDQYKVSVILTAKQFEDLRRVQSLEAQRQKTSKMTDAIGRGLEVYLRRNDPVQKAQRSEARKAKKITLKLSDGSHRPNPNPNSKLNDVALFEHGKIDRGVLTQKEPGDPSARVTANDNGDVRAPGKISGNGDLVRTTKPFARVRFTAEEKHQVTLKTGGRCCLKDRNGKRCENDRWLDIHHIVPVSRGGTNEIDNLVHVCGLHHDLIHQVALPLDDEITWWTFEFSGEDTLEKRHG